EVDADILILTETSVSVNPGYRYSQISTEPLRADVDGIKYQLGENRTTIWTRYRVTNTLTTVDKYTSIAADLETPLRPLRVYGTIIGVFGGKGERFASDLNNQLADFDRLFSDK